MLQKDRRRWPGFRTTIGFAGGAKGRARWVWLPQEDFCLEERALLSALAGSLAPRPSDSGGSARAFADSSSVPPSWTEVPECVVSDGGRPIRAARRLHTRYPAPAGGYPVIVAIHGGGWRRFDKTVMACGSPTPSSGMVTWWSRPTTCCRHRASPTWPVNFEDVQAAVRWVRSNAGTLDINPNEIVARENRPGPIWPPCSGRIPLRIAASTAFPRPSTPSSRLRLRPI